MQSSTTPLEVTYLRTTSLKPDPRNPRVHSDKQVRQIAQSIESFGFNVPLLIDDEQVVIAGHGRLQAARKLGWETVPAIRLSHLRAWPRSSQFVDGVLIHFRNSRVEAELEGFQPVCPAARVHR